MITRNAVTLTAAFSSMLLVGVSIQVATPFIVPSVSVAFLDGGVFRTWSGFGWRETVVQAGVLSAFLGCWFAMLSRYLASECGGVRTMVRLTVPPIFFGTATMCLVTYLAIRVPETVVLMWAFQTLSQLVIGTVTFAYVLRRTATGVAWRRFMIVHAVSWSLLVGVLSIAYCFPTPRPDESFVLQQNDGDRITVDCFFPPGSGHEKLPTVVVLHGVEGATQLSRQAVHYANARAISDQGYATFFVHYFDTSPYEHLMLFKEGELDVPTIEEIRLKDYDEWINVACAALERIRERPDVAADRMALIGYSLGCYVGTAATSRMCDTGCPVIMVGNFGAVWPDVEVDPSFPPIRFYHGADDSVIPLQDVQRAVGRLRERGAATVELVVLPGQGHIPDGPTSLEVRRSTHEFLRKHLE